jgi:hypothetical protein
MSADHGDVRADKRVSAGFSPDPVLEVLTSLQRVSPALFAELPNGIRQMAGAYIYTRERHLAAGGDVPGAEVERPKADGAAEINAAIRRAAGREATPEAEG